MEKTDKYNPNIFDNSKLEENLTYSKKEAFEDIKNQRINMLAKWISIFKSKGLLGYIFFTFLIFGIFWDKYTEVFNQAKQSLQEAQISGEKINSVEILITIIALPLLILIILCLPVRLYYYNKKTFLNK